MFDLSLFMAFVAAASILTLTPGIDTAMVLRTSAVQGMRAASRAAIGIALGCLAWGMAVSLGLGVLLQASEIAYAAVKWAGAAYLLWLGAKLLWKPRAHFSTDHASTGTAAEASVQPNPVVGARNALRQGFLTNILNPKVGVFYVTFLPQFIPAGASVAFYSFLLATVHVVLALLWFAVLIAATAPLKRVLQKPQVIRCLDRLTGGVFVAFGIKLALSKQ